jgi:hypothetical protein
VEHFGQRFHGSRFPGSCRSEQENHADRPSLGRQPGLMHLYERHDGFDGFILPDEQLA